MPNTLLVVLAIVFSVVGFITVVEWLIDRVVSFMAPQRTIMELNYKNRELMALLYDALPAVSSHYDMLELAEEIKIAIDLSSDYKARGKEEADAWPVPRRVRRSLAEN